MHNDGSMLTTTIRGVDCYGSDFQTLTPEGESDHFNSMAAVSSAI